MKKIIILLAAFTYLFSCKEKKAEQAKEKVSEIAISKNKNTEKNKSDFKSNLRPNEDIEKGKEYQDEVVFIKTDEEGDYPLLFVEKNRKPITLIFSDLETDNFSKTASYQQGDIISIRWNIDTAEMAGDGDKPYLTEFLLNSARIKEGKLSQFNKTHTNPFRVEHIEADFSENYLKNIDQKVRYYLANTKEPLLISELKNPDSNLMYSIEEQEREDRKYVAIALINTFENHQNTLRWLYINLATDELYDYDLPNDKLIKFY